MSSTRFDPPVPTLEQLNGDGVTTTPDSDGFIVPGENDYSSSKNKSTLRSYISNLTKGIAPGGPLDPNVIEYNGPTPPPHANPFPVEAVDRRQTKFIDQDGLVDTISRDALPGSPFDRGTDLSSIVRTGPLGEANDTVTLSGHELLPGVVGSETPDGPVRTTTAGAKAYVTSLGQALKSHNLNSGKLAVEGGEEFESRDFSHESVTDGVTTTARVKLGDTLDGIASRSYDVPNVERTDHNDLRRVAVDMMNRAMGDDGVSGRSGGKSLAQQGRRKISSNSTRAAAVESFRDLNRTTRSGGQNDLPSGEPDDGTGTTYTTESWPSTYSPDEPYTGFNSTSGAFAAFVTSGAFLAAVIATSAVGTFLPAIAKGLIPAEVNQGTIHNNKKLKLGEFRVVENNSFLQGLTTTLEVASNITGLNIRNPIHIVTNKYTDYPGCVIAGLASFLGVSYGISVDLIKPFTILGKSVPVNPNVAIITAEIAIRIIAIFADPASRQYYMNVIRELNRNTLVLGGELSNVSLRGGFSSAAENSLGAISSIFDSKLFKFVNTLAKIGDLAYTQAAAIDYRGTDVESNPDDVYSTFDSGSPKTLNTQASKMRGFGARRIYGDRIEGRRGVSYSLSDLPSYHLVPTGSTQTYRNLLNSVPGKNGERITSVRPENVNGKYHFTPEQVSAIESVLEAEYMPFYFQDLRTNEIISFHAFLDDLSDSYSANYNSAGGYGRVEEIKTYKDTKRSVGCTFHIVATNPEDFDYMWWQINKLTTMVYPQWSQGRSLIGQVNSTNFNFTQPFSQIPTATPLIRFRVGDLIRSNYSRFNLKRLFGYQDVEKKQSAAGTSDVYYFVPPGQYWNGTDQVEITLPIQIGSSKPRPLTQDENRIAFGRIEVISLEAGGKIFVEPERIQSDVLTSEAGENVINFYKNENNTIIKSFETTRGLGLAAVVTQLGFTWMDGLWGAGDDGPGNRAPRACKVQMSFEPIHDIAPGLDHEGFNRAPIYPVGKLINGIVEGGESEPYGVGTSQRSTSGARINIDEKEYKDRNKQSILQKLF